MNAGQKSARRLAAAKAWPARDTICTSCLNRLSRHASTAAATAEQSQSASVPQHIPPVTSTAPKKAYAVLASPVVSRPPLLTRSLTSFEKAYFLYQKRLNERLALPFTRYFYYKKGTPADVEWKRKAKTRQTAARDIGIYNAYGKEGWNDEILVGDPVSEPEFQVESLIRDAEGKDTVSAQPVGDAETGGESIGGDAREGEGVKKDVGISIQRPMPRRTEADEKNDVRSLNRKLDRSLYLLVKNSEGRWRFPEDRVVGRENLHQAAERILVQSCGINMNTWVVGNHPVGHFHFNFPSPQHRTITHPATAAEPQPRQEEVQDFGEKVFFMKTRIMAGQADLSKTAFGLSDFQWLAKEEVEKTVTPKYWSSVRNMLAER